MTDTIRPELDLLRVRNVLADVEDERIAQHAKWGQQSYLDGTGPALRSPIATLGHGNAHNAAVEEKMTQRCQREFAIGNAAWEPILTEEYAEALATGNRAALRTELIQIAAVCVAWAEDIDRDGEQA